VLLFTVLDNTLRYWIEFVLGLICYRSVVDAYEKISFEIEAFEAEKEVT